MTTQGQSLLKTIADDQILFLRLNRPEQMNALDEELRNSIAAAIEEFDRDAQLRVAVLVGEGGRAFSAGADLKELAQRPPLGREGRIPYDQLERCRKPLIAAIDGYCLAGGFELTLHCDIRLATEQSQFGLPEPRWSLLGGPGLHHLSRTIPLGEALLLQLTGGRMDARRAFEIGLVQRLAADRDELMQSVDDVASQILLCAPLAVEAIKRVVKCGRDLPPEYSRKLAEPLVEMIARTRDREEGPRAFAERRMPVWRME